MQRRALTKEDPKLLGEAINKWTLDALARKEFHDVPEILIARPTELGIEVKVKDKKSAGADSNSHSVLPSNQ